MVDFFITWVCCAVYARSAPSKLTDLTKRWTYHQPLSMSVGCGRKPSWWHHTQRPLRGHCGSSAPPWIYESAPVLLCPIPAPVETDNRTKVKMFPADKPGRMNTKLCNFTLHYRLFMKSSAHSVQQSDSILYIYCLRRTHYQGLN